MPLYDFVCPKCRNWRDDVLVRSDAEYKCDLCDTVMDRQLPLVAPPVFAKGRSAESQHEWGIKERARLEKRSLDYDTKGKGKQEREGQIEKLKANGTIPEGWSA